MIVSTHIAPRKSDEIQFAQIHFLLEQLLCMVSEFHKSGICPEDVPIIICGDFNVTPSSASYKLLSQNSTWVSPSPFEFPDLYHLNILGDIPVQFPAMHYLPLLKSAYQTIYGSEPPHTNSVPSFQEVVDYVWYTCGDDDDENGDFKSPAFRLDNVVQIINNSDDTFLPNEQNPSDHYPIECTFSVLCPKSSQTCKKLNPDQNKQIIAHTTETAVSFSSVIKDESSTDKMSFDGHWKNSFKKKQERGGSSTSPPPLDLKQKLSWRRE